MNRRALVILIAFAAGFALALLCGCTNIEPLRHGGWTPAPWAAEPLIT